ncbi:MAG: hypothetical protein WCL21_06645 [Mariniphaga sp.]
MDKIEIYISVTITILGLAYPILLQVIARLDEKYGSTLIVELFDKEQIKKWFKILLVTSLVSIFIWTFKFKPFIQLDGWDYLINNSANILILLNATALVVLFFQFVNKILVYYTPAKFINYLIGKHNKKGSDLQYFKALTDVFLLSVQKQNQTISQTLSRFFYDAFKKEREKSNSKAVEYPEAYYSLVYKSIEELAIQKNKKNSSLEYSTAGSIWLLGEMSEYEISEVTYIWLWRNILLAIKYEQDDMILYHWETADRFFEYCLNYVPAVHNKENFEITNKEAIEKREQERHKFLEFHYALGGLLMYKKRYNCINRIFRYTTSQPPRFELLPETMNELFYRYMEFRDPYDLKYAFISSKYGFPEQNGIGSDGVVKKWISSYLSVLFLRQYTIIPYLITMRPLDFPALPKTQGEKRQWNIELDFFKKLVIETTDNIELIEILNFKFITKEWCKESKKPDPIDFINELKELLTQKYEEGATSQTVSDEKRNLFYNSSSMILEKTFLLFSQIKNKIIYTENYNKWFISGLRMIQDKDPFSENPETCHLNYDTFLATETGGIIKDGISQTFLYKRSRSYLLKPEDIFKGIEELDANENYLILSFGINISYYIDYFKVKGLTLDQFNGLLIIQVPGSRIVSPSIFIIKKDELPNIISQEIGAEIIGRFSLEKINEEYKIYASVLDLNLVTEEIRAENSQGKSEDELRKSVLLSLTVNTEIRWKKSVELVQFIEYSEYRQQGLPNGLSDIIKLKKT